MASAPLEFTYARIDVPEGVTDLTGLTSGMVTVLWPTRGPKRDLRWMCQCQCGNRKAMPGAPLRVGETQSCGCLRIKDPEGIRKTRLHGIWRGMINRCRDISREGYGGRGIQVSKEWREYEAFQRWAMAHGYADDLTIDRRDNDGDYCPDNCHWITMLQQSRNTRRTVWVEHAGKTVSLAEAAADLGASYHQLHDRVKRKGMTLPAALADIAAGGCQSPQYLRMAEGLARKRAKKAAA